MILQNNTKEGILMNFKKTLSSALATTMLLSAFSFANAEAQATNKAEDILKTGSEYSTVYYGGIPWRVLDKEFSDGQDNAKDGIYLLSEYAYEHGTFWNTHYGPGDYNGNFHKT